MTRADVVRYALSAAVCLASACGPPSTAAPRDRSAQARPILEAVLRYELAQFASPRAPGEVTCAGVAEGAEVHDPDPGLLGRLGSGIKARSACGATPAALVIAGPIEWSSDGEARVKGSFTPPVKAAVRSEYRVVWEAGGWSCLGPVMGYDPL